MPKEHSSDAIQVSALSEVKPLRAQRNRAEELLRSFGIGPNYQLTYVEALNAMTLFVLNESRLALASASASPHPGCISCGFTRVVGYTVEGKPGPFCSKCWDALKVSVREVDAYNASVSALPASASPSNRLLELATVQASEKHHQWTAGIGWDVADNHVAPMNTCPHPDCVLVRASASPGSGEGWQPIDTFPRGLRDALFWVVPKTPEESYINTSGDLIFGMFKPYMMRGGYGQWSSLSKALLWHRLPSDPSALPASEGQETPAQTEQK